NRPRQYHDWIGRTKITPGMPAGSAHDHFKTAATQRLGDDGVRPGAVKHQGVINRIFPARRRENVAHAAKVALSFLADISDEQERQNMPDSNRTQKCCYRQHRGHACSVVGNTRPVESGSLLAYVQGRSGGENSVDVGAQSDIALAESRMTAENIAHVITVNIVEAKFAKFLRHPLRTCRFRERRRRDARQFKLPVRELWFLRAQPGKGRTDFWRCRKPSHFLLQAGEAFRHFCARTESHWI